MRDLLMLMLVGVTLGRAPPLNVLNHSPFFSQLRFEGSVMQDLWDQYTVKGTEPPMLEHTHLNGANFTTTLQGKTMRTMNNRIIYAFQGIRFGEAPIGELRFKRTNPAGVYWEEDEVLEADHIGDMCPQKAMLGKVAAGSEDCLFLNVYTPYLPGDLPDGKLLPVMFFIHGGAFVNGDASLYLPTKLLDRDVILVVIHYRLGSLGFFSLVNDKAPGNAGIWDQILAMEWVRDNIDGFGGDKDGVTIFGESAGSASVNYHLILPASRGLFRGVIGESGSALEHWSHDSDPIGSAFAVGHNAGCQTNDADELYECMLNMTADHMSLSMAAFVAKDRSQGGMGFKGAAPVTQGSNVSDRLLEHDPLQYFLDGNVTDVPLMIGANKHEGSFVLGIMYAEFLEPNNLTDDKHYMRTRMIDDLLAAFGVMDKTGGLSESLADAYVGDRDLGDFPYAAPGLIDMAGVLFLKAGAWMTAKYHAQTTASNTYFYSFEFESDDTMFRWLFMGHSEMPFRPGVTHSDDLMYLFPLPAELEDQQLVVKDRMVRMWTNFAIYGDPTPEADKKSWEELDIVKWQSLTKDTHYFMLVQDECSLQVEYPDRWHIAFEESDNTTTNSGPTWEEYNNLQRKSQDFMISMIVFIVAAVVLGAFAVYVFYKQR
ncbi:juvenile hormone esterase-like [Homarus americanus]|uniref:juvenile hormone esterase-like n=1 Tax=Homarus americanus TaxID=6706 RepID=UPI001C48450E|nr:juvenile hormone esterase-like [Homarus americanus]